MKALIVYAIRYGATARTSQEIAKTLREENFEVKITDAKKEKIKTFRNSILLSLAAVRAFEWNNLIPKDRIKVLVQDGRVTLRGEVVKRRKLKIQFVALEELVSSII